MASSITILQVTPSRVYFRLNLELNSNPSFMKSGAAGIDKDLSSLETGPLKEYLNRLVTWADVGNVSGGSGKLVWRVAGGEVIQLPVLAGNAVGMVLAQNGQTSVSFTAGAAGTTRLTLELAFIHSAQR